ncbi:MAG TPA: hypothetical protein VI980_02020 [Acidimicrobiia bacterium]|nr:hypothetical protein [Acidimicrobiia bacterium]
MELSAATMGTAGTLLLAIAAVEYGGVFMLSIHRGKKEFTDFQRASFWAGHAHAGVSVILSLVALLYADALEMSGFDRFAGRSTIPLAAILMPAGFFLSAIGEQRTRPNRLIVLIYLGAVSLAVGVVTLGLELLTA